MSGVVISAITPQNKVHVLILTKSLFTVCVLKPTHALIEQLDRKIGKIQKNSTRPSFNKTEQTFTEHSIQEQWNTSSFQIHLEHIPRYMVPRVVKIPLRTQYNGSNPKIWQHQMLLSVWSNGSFSGSSDTWALEAGSLDWNLALPLKVWLWPKSSASQMLQFLSYTEFSQT